MTYRNMELDFNIKLTEAAERRSQIREQTKNAMDNHLKEEAAEKRRQEQIKTQENRFSLNQQKRDEANRRR